MRRSLLFALRCAHAALWAILVGLLCLAFPAGWVHLLQGGLPYLLHAASRGALCSALFLLAVHPLLRKKDHTPFSVGWTVLCTAVSALFGGWIIPLGACVGCILSLALDRLLFFLCSISGKPGAKPQREPTERTE